MSSSLHEQLRAVDHQNMKAELTAFPEMWAEGRAIGLAGGLGALEGRRFGHVVVTGMGGSAIGGDFLRTFALDDASAPILVNRGYDLPGFVGRDSLVVVSSYSGNTEETLAAYADARDRSAAIVCITSGGQVAELAEEHGHAVLRIPGGHPPRAALPYSLAPLLTVAERLGIIRVQDAAWSEAEALLVEGVARWGGEEPGQAGKLAALSHGRLTLVYTGPGFPEAVGLRWRGQWSENAKTLAFGNTFPELNHNEIVGWEHSPHLMDRLGVVVLVDREDDPRIRRRMEVTRELLASRCAFWETVESRGESRLARMLSLIQLGDWVSLYLAGLNGEDPTPVVPIDRLKEALAGG